MAEKIEKFCYWQFEGRESLCCSENCMNLENFKCPYKITDVKHKEGKFSIEGCLVFTPLDILKEYFNKNQNTSPA